MPGPPPKAAARRQRSKRDMGADIGLVSSSGTAPKMPTRLCAPAKAAWNAYWGDVLSGVMRESDAPLVLRWARNLDRYHRLAAGAGLGRRPWRLFPLLLRRLWRLCVDFGHQSGRRLTVGPAARSRPERGGFGPALARAWPRLGPGPVTDRRATVAGSPRVTPGSG